MWIWHCPVWNIALNLSWKSHPLPIDSIIPLGGCCLKGAGTCWKSLMLLLRLCSTSPPQSRLPGAIGIEHRPKSALLALYQGITQGMLQAMLQSPVQSQGSFPILLKFSKTIKKKKEKEIKSLQLIKEEEKNKKKTCSTFGS